MSQLSNAGFNTAYADTSGTFADNTTRLITEGDMRQFSDDINDSFLNITDQLQAAAPTDYGLSTKASSTFMTCYSTYVDIASSSVLTANSSPVTIVAAPSADYVIVPVMFFVGLERVSASYVGNTTFRFEIDGVAVTGTNTTILPSVVDRWTTILPIAYDTSNDMRGKSLVFKVQGGDSSTGDSALNVGCVYKIFRWGIPA